MSNCLDKDTTMTYLPHTWQARWSLTWTMHVKHFQLVLDQCPVGHPYQVCSDRQKIVTGRFQTCARQGKQISTLLTTKLTPSEMNTRRTVHGWMLTIKAWKPRVTTQLRPVKTHLRGNYPWVNLQGHRVPIEKTVVVCRFRTCRGEAKETDLYAVWCSLWPGCSWLEPPRKSSMSEFQGISW